MSKFRQSASDESSNSSSVEESAPDAVGADDESPDEPAGLSTTDVAVSPLALMNENSPEAWLGQFLLKLDSPTSTPRGTLEGARRDPQLKEYLESVRALAGQVSPLSLLDPDNAAQLRATNWADWWEAQGHLLSYAYSTLALSLLGHGTFVEDLCAMHEQESNMQLRKDAHYVICYRLGKPWPSYVVVESDYAKLANREQ